MVYNTTTLAVSLMAKSCELHTKTINEGLIAFPKNAHHHFTIRLLNRMLQSYGIKIEAQGAGQHMSTLQQNSENECLILYRAATQRGVLTAKTKLFAVAPTKFAGDIDPEFKGAQVQIVTDELVEMALQHTPAEEYVPFTVLLKDGMIVVREQTLSHIIGITSSLNIPGGAYVEDIICAIYIAKTLRVSIEEIRAAITELCLQTMEMEMIAEKYGIRYFDNSNVKTEDECVAILSCFGGAVSVIIGGAHFAHSAKLEDALVKAKAHVVLLPGTQERCSKGLHERLPNVSDDLTHLSEIVHEAESFLTDGGSILYFPSLNSNDVEQGSFEFFKEVLKS